MIWEIKSPADSIHFVGHFTCIQIVVFVHIFSILSFDFIQRRPFIWQRTMKNQSKNRKWEKLWKLNFLSISLSFPNIDKNQAKTPILFCNILPQIQRYLLVTTTIIESLKNTIFDKKGKKKTKSPSLCSNNNGEIVVVCCWKLEKNSNISWPKAVLIKPRNE